MSTIFVKKKEDTNPEEDDRIHYDEAENVYANRFFILLFLSLSFSLFLLLDFLILNRSFC